MNAIFNRSLSFKLALAIFAIVGLVWLFNDNSPSNNQQTAQPKQYSSDYSMTDFVMTVMDKQGRPSRIIKGAEASHYPIGDTSEIISPEVLVIDPENDDWLLVADRADTEGKGELVVLTGNVIITNQDEPEVQLFTDLLNIDTQYDTAYTEHAVLMKAPQGDTNAVGLHADLQERTINLHSRVKGQYNAPATN